MATYINSIKEIPAKVFIVNAVQDARSTGTEIVCIIQRGYEHRATQ